LRTLEDKTFLLLTVAISLAFGWILWPFYGAVLWATILAIVFVPLYRRLSRSMRQRRNLAALVTVTIVVAIVILPSALIAASLIQEASGLYEKFHSGELIVIFSQSWTPCRHG
jgi:predicted PurR-regulated permease PerM